LSFLSTRQNGKFSALFSLLVRDGYGLEIISFVSNLTLLDISPWAKRGFRAVRKQPLRPGILNLL
jgi:hypothetical protein